MLFRSGVYWVRFRGLGWVIVVVIIVVVVVVIVTLVFGFVFVAILVLVFAIGESKVNHRNLPNLYDVMVQMDF